MNDIKPGIKIERPIDMASLPVGERKQNALGKSLRDALSTGNSSEKRFVNGMLFTHAEREVNEQDRRRLHAEHFNLVITHVKEPALIPHPSNRIDEFIVDGVLPPGFLLAKGYVNKEWIYASIDLENFEDVYMQFCESYRRYCEKPGIPIIEGQSLPNEVTAGIKATMNAVFNFFGLVNEDTARKNTEKYLQKPRNSYLSLNERGILEQQHVQNMQH